MKRSLVQQAISNQSNLNPLKTVLAITKVHESNKKLRMNGVCMAEKELKNRTF